MSDVPNWLKPVIDAVAAALEVHGPEGQLGLRYRRVEKQWDLLFYPMPVEMVGGPHDGGLAAVGFSLDVQKLLAAFTQVEAVGWDAHGTSADDEQDGPALAIQGQCAGRNVWLRVLAFAPDGVAATAKVDGTRHRRAG